MQKVLGSKASWAQSLGHFRIRGWLAHGYTGGVRDGALQYNRPFVAPLFTFVSLHRPGTKERLPVYVLVVLRWLLSRIRKRRAHPVRRRATLE